MGRIAAAVEHAPDESTGHVFTNKVDRILEECDDDEDRAIVLAKLRSSMSDEDVEYWFRDLDIGCSDTTIRRWRKEQQRGAGRSWDA